MRRFVGSARAERRQQEEREGDETPLVGRAPRGRSVDQGIGASNDHAAIDGVGADAPSRTVRHRCAVNVMYQAARANDGAIGRSSPRRGAGDHFQGKSVRSPSPKSAYGRRCMQRRRSATPPSATAVPVDGFSI